MTDFSGVRLIVAGDVCDDVLIAGTLTRFSREALGVPVLDIAHRSTIQGGAAASFRQVQALGAEAVLVPTGRPADKTRLIAVADHESRHLARFDDPWPPYDALSFTRLMRGHEASGVLYCQYRPEAPPRPILEALRGFSLRVGDVRDPAAFVGVLDVVKVAREHAEEKVTGGSPAQMARLFCEKWGFRCVVVTCGKDGYVAATAEGAEIMEKGLNGGVRVSGAGDVFTATLAVSLAAKTELREALSLANKAAGLACRKPDHLSVVCAEELTTS